MHKLNDRKIEEKICYEGLYSELQIVSSVYLVNHVDSDSYCSKHYDRNRELFAVLRRKYLIHYRRYKYVLCVIREELLRVENTVLSKGAYLRI